MNKKESIQKLTEARNLIDEKGWCRGHYTDHRGHHCIHGALQTIDWNNCLELSQLLLDNIGELPRPSSQAIVIWNDAPSRRKRDVLRLFDRTIKSLEVTA